MNILVLHSFSAPSGYSYFTSLRKTAGLLIAAHIRSLKFLLFLQRLLLLVLQYRLQILQQHYRQQYYI